MVKASTQYKREHKKDYGHEKVDILYEDPYLMIILKPSGILSVPYEGSKARTAIDAVEQIMRKNGSYAKNHRPFVVHRLDRDTSGVMMFAMTETAQKKIMDTWHTMVTERLYRAVAENPKKGLLPPQGCIDAPLAYNAHNIGFVPRPSDTPSESAYKHRAHQSHDATSIYERNLHFKDGKAEFKTITARTNYTIIAQGLTHTLFELSLDTGRKNQIRAHLSYMGYPLAGDENYRAKTDPFKRLALHARTLEFDHPFTGKHLKFEVTEPEEWLTYVQKGDPHPATPIWNKREAHTMPEMNHNAIKKPVSHKKLAGMDYISRGKLIGKNKKS